MVSPPEPAKVRVLDVRNEEPVVELTVRADPRQALIDWLTSEYGSGYDWVLASFTYDADAPVGDAIAHVRPLGRAERERDADRKAGRS